jgi:EmrB/QacA subfamily drug resistance transporter
VNNDTFQPLPRRQVILTMGGVMLAIFLASLDQTIVSTAMPRIVADLGGFSKFTWITTAYLVASTTIVPIVGKLTDMYGRKSFFIGGIIIFLAGSVLAGLSQTMNQLIVFRGIQGLGGGIMMANAFVSIGDLFPPSERGKYQGFVAAVFGFSSVIGPTMGGFITDTLSWHWIFFINLPLGIPAIGLFIRFFPQRKLSGVRHKLDMLGMATLMLAVVSLLLGLSWGGVQYPWTSPQIIGMLVFAAVMTAAFIAVELRAPEPIMPFEIYKNRTVTLSLIATFFTGFAMFGGIVFIPLYSQGVLGASATSSGSFLTPMMLGIVLSSTLSGQILSRWGGHYRLQGLVGVGVMATGMILFSRMTAETSFAQAVVSIVIIGLGLGTTFPVFTIAVQNAVPYRQIGVVTSATQFYRQIGGTLGLALLGALMTRQFASSLLTSISPQVRQAVPQERLAELANDPQALMSPQALDALQNAFGQLGPQGAALLQQLLLTLRASLATAISDVFIVGAAVLAIAFVFTLFLKEAPLRQGQRERASGASAAAKETPV